MGNVAAKQVKIAGQLLPTAGVGFAVMVAVSRVENSRLRELESRMMAGDEALENQIHKMHTELEHMLSDKKERGGLVPSMLVGALAMLGAGTACVVLLGLYRKRQRRRSIKANAASATAAAAGGGTTPAEGEGGGVEPASGGGGVAELVLSTGGPLLVELPRAGEGEGEEELDWGEQAGGLGSHDDHSDFSLEGILENLTDIPSVPSMSGGEEEGASTLGEEEDDDADLKQPDSEDEGRGQYQWGEASVESMGKTDEVEASKEGEHTAADGGKAEDEPEPEEGGKVAEEADEEEDEWCVVPETAHPGHSQ